MKYEVTIVLCDTYDADSPDEAIYAIRRELEDAGVHYEIVATGARPMPGDDQGGP